MLTATDSAAAESPLRRPHDGPGSGRSTAALQCVRQSPLSALSAAGENDYPRTTSAYGPAQESDPETKEKNSPAFAQA